MAAEGEFESLSGVHCLTCCCLQPLLIHLFTGATMATLTLVDLKCVAPSDPGGADEPMLQVKGSTLECLVYPELRAGETWPINESFEFVRAAIIELWDIDSRDGAPDNDDVIGVHVVRAIDADRSQQTIVFREIGGEYELTYVVK
jgi:hypothetical protein